MEVPLPKLNVPPPSLNVPLECATLLVTFIVPLSKLKYAVAPDIVKVLVVIVATEVNTAVEGAVQLIPEVLVRLLYPKSIVPATTANVVQVQAPVTYKAFGITPMLMLTAPVVLF